MRVNVYGEELTSEVELVTKTAGERTFYGIRIFLASSDELHFTPSDDDRSAITLWVPWTASAGHDFDLMTHLLAGIQATIEDARVAVITDAAERV